jgi:putative flippase GtrA
MRLIARQFSAFVIVGLIAAVAHYGTLIGLVEARLMGPVPATLLGFLAGAAVSYVLNRRFAFESDRPHREALWRFGIVSVVGFTLTGLIMAVLTGPLNAPYLPAQVLTTGIVLFWNFLANRYWTFSGPPVP